MAIDVYLRIEGIKGESADGRHKDWIECQSVTWSISQPRSATATTAGGHTAERCEHGEVVITKLADLSSPVLLQACSTGRTIARAHLEFLRADGNGERIKYFEIALENLLIGGVFPAIHEGELLSEHVGLRYSKAKWQYTRQKIGGGACGNTAGGWDLAGNRIC